MRIYLTGFMGSGKTVVGGALAELRKASFMDLDREIEQVAGTSIREIFRLQGEPAFRDLEHRALRATSGLEDVVVATGGGTVTFERNLLILRELGVSVWLNPSFETIVQRIGGRGQRDRPLFHSEEQALELYRSRLEAYRLADFEVAIRSDEAPREIAHRIDLLLRERRCVI